MNVYLALFLGGHGRLDKYATVLANTFEAAEAKTHSLRSELALGFSCTTIVLADETDVNVHSASLVDDLTADQYLGIFTAEARPPRLEIILESAGEFTLADQQFIRSQLSGYDIISIREIE